MKDFELWAFATDWPSLNFLEGWGEFGGRFAEEHLVEDEIPAVVAGVRACRQRVGQLAGLDPQAGLELTRQAAFLVAMVPAGLGLVEEKKAVLAIQPPAEAVAVHVLIIHISLIDGGLEGEPIERMECKPGTGCSHRITWAARGKVQGEEGGPAECAVEESAAVVRNDEFRIGRELADAQGNFVIEQGLLKPEIQHAQGVEPGDIRDGEKVADEILAGIPSA